MGLNQAYLGYVNKCINDTSGQMRGKRMLEIGNQEMINGLICSCLQKKEDISFMENRREFLKYITRRSKGIIYPGINDRGIVGFLYKIRKIINDLIIQALCVINWVYIDGGGGKNKSDK